MAKAIEAYKLRTEIEVINSKASSALRQTEREVDNVGRSFERLGPRIERSMRRASDSFRGPLGAGGNGGSFLPGMGNISEIIQGIPQIGRLAGGLIRPLTDASEEGIRLNFVLEAAEISFEGVAGSADKARAHIAAMRDFGERSPFRFEGLLETSQLMKTFGFSLDEQIPKLTTWGNAIASTGDLSAEKVSAVVRGFGQMKMLNRVNAEDMNQLINAGIDGWGLLAKAIGKTVTETRKLSDRGLLKGAPAVEAITAMMAIDPRYKDMMKRMENTGFGRLSTAQDKLQFAQATATQALARDTSDMLGLALQNENLVGELAGKINLAIAPVSGMIKTAAVSLLGGSLTAGFIEGIEAGKGAAQKAMIDFGMNGVIKTFTDLFGIESPSKLFEYYGEMTVEGLEEGLVDRTSKGFDRWREALEKAGGDAFISAIEGMAHRLGVNPAWILNVMAFESGFNAKAANPRSSGRGLIQFMNPTARGLGFRNSSQITKLNEMGQLPLVERYFAPFAGRMQNQGDVYAAVAAGTLGGPGGVLFRKGSKEYKANKIWDVNADGIITSQEIGGLAAQKGGFTSAPTVGGTISGGAVYFEKQKVGGTVAGGAVQFMTGIVGGGVGSVKNPIAVVHVGGTVGGGAVQFEKNQNLKDYVLTLGIEDAAIVDVTASKHQLIEVDKKALDAQQKLLATTSLVPRALTVLTKAEEEHAEAVTALAGSFYKSVVGSIGVMTQLSGMIGQISGFMPQQQVGKKRGFWSKVLGVAAPFLSFIPGAGPILSQIAGMASAGLAGNWSGVITGLAGGLAPGGVFRPSGGGPTSGPSNTPGTYPGEGLPPRALGGPGRRGHIYWTGERGPEPFIAPSNGYFLSHSDAMRAMSGGGYSEAAMIAAIEKLNATQERQNNMLARLEGVSPNDVVRMGARGYIDALDQDAGLIRLQGRRQRLA